MPYDTGRLPSSVLVSLSRRLEASLEEGDGTTARVPSKGDVSWLVADTASFGRLSFRADIANDLLLARGELGSPQLMGSTSCEKGKIQK